MSLSENFNAEIYSIENRFNGGLSNTSTKKFDELVKIATDYQNNVRQLNEIRNHLEHKLKMTV